MAHVCSPHHVKWFDNLLRPLVHSPRKMFGPYVSAGATVLDIGCGAGFASIGLARLVGEEGKVISVDLQKEMLDKVRKRAEKAHLASRITLHQCEADDLGLREEVDLVNAFWMVHETPDSGKFLGQVFELLKPGGRFLIAEPLIHVSSKTFSRMVDVAKDVGFQIECCPPVAISRAVILSCRRIG